MSKITICEGEILYTSKGNTLIHAFDGNIVCRANGKNIWQGEKGTEIGNYQKMNLPFSEDGQQKKCFCEEEVTVEGIKSFYKSKKLFIAKNCPLPEDAKTYEAFTDSLNKAMKGNGINTCLKKANFLAQIETESDKLNTTMEYASGWDYDHSTHEHNYNSFKPYANYKKDKKLSEELHKKYTIEQIKKLQRGYNRYLECLKHGHNIKGYGPKYKGKGLIQLTWKDTYEKYFKHLNKLELIDTPEIVANDLIYSCDSAGWFWNDRKLGEYADKDDLIYISVKINGGLNGFSHRKSNVKNILKLMKVKENCKNLKLKNIGIYKYEKVILKQLTGEKEINPILKNLMIKLLFINILSLPFFFVYSQNIEGKYYSTNDHCKVNLTIRKNNIYEFNFGKRKIKKGKLKLIKENEITYLDFDEISSMYSNDTIYIQNSGNSSNEYLYFKECDEKFIHLVKRLNLTDKKIKKNCNQKSGCDLLEEKIKKLMQRQIQKTL